MGFAGCGGSGSNDNFQPNNEQPTPPPTQPEQQQIAGIYSGETSKSQDVDILVQQDGTFWAIYSLPSEKEYIGGFIQGALSVNEGKATSSNSKDFYLEGGQLYTTTINANIDSKKSLKGGIQYNPSNTVTFDTSFNKDLNTSSPTLERISGTYYGEGILLQGYEDTKVVIEKNGNVSGIGDSGCKFAGTAKPATDGGNYYTLQVKFSGYPCYLAEQSLTGVIVRDSDTKTISAAAVNQSRDSGFYYVGN